MSDDDDTGGHTHHKLAEEAKKPVTLKLWIVLAIALAAFVLGAWLL